MPPRPRVQSFAFSLALTCSVACAGEPPLVPVSPAASAVRIETTDPPRSAVLLGPLEVSDGAGCGIGGDKGSLQNAKRALQNAALRLGADFVKLTQIKQPYSGRDCYHQEFRLSGLGYRVASAEAPPVWRPSSSLTPASSGPPELGPVAGATVSSLCSPACAVGYSCTGGVCEARCEPTCRAHEVCRADRVCVPEKSP